MTGKSTWRACAIVAVGLLVLGPAAGAQDEDTAQLVIPAGIDIWSTPDVGANTGPISIPRGFFCDAFPGRNVSQIPLKGKPLVTSPAGVLGSTDTVVLRRTNAAFGADGTATVPIEVVGLSLVGSAPFDVPECGESYTVVVCRGANQPPGNTITIAHDGSNGGTFDADLAVSGTISFKNAGGTLLLTDDHVVYLTTSDAYWANQVGSGGINHSGSVQLDQSCSGQASGPSYPGTAGFHPGWSWNPPPSHACPSPPCKVPTKHEGPHPDTLPPAKLVTPAEPVPVDPVEPTQASLTTTPSGSTQGA